MTPKSKPLQTPYDFLQCLFSLNFLSYYSVISNPNQEVCTGIVVFSINPSHIFCTFLSGSSEIAAISFCEYPRENILKTVLRSFSLACLLIYFFISFRVAALASSAYICIAPSHALHISFTSTTSSSTNSYCSSNIARSHLVS